MQSLFVIACLLATTFADQKSYEGYKVYNVSPNTKSQAGALNTWLDVDGVDFWDSPRSAVQNGRVMIAPSVLDKFEEFLVESGVNYQLIIENVEITLQNERVEIASQNAKLLANKVEGRHTTDFNHFWDYEEIYEYIDELAEEHPELISVETGGLTSEGREIKVVKISTTGVQGDKPIIFIEVGMHAREWATYVAGIHLIHELVEHYDHHSDVVDNVDWIIIPVANPDGYAFSHTDSRLWRKTRAVNEGSACLGIDGDRNFGYQWGSASQDPCSDTFEGITAHSAPETKLITEILEQFAGQINIYLTVHSYGSNLLFPWGYDFIAHENHDELQALGETVASAISVSRGTNYTVGNAASLLYPASGTSYDYAAGAANIPYSFKIELPSSGDTGFELPIEEIEQVVQETFLGFLAFAEFLVEQSEN